MMRSWSPAAVCLNRSRSTTYLQGSNEAAVLNKEGCDPHRAQATGPDAQRADVVRPTAEMVFPEALLPEPVPVHVFVVVAERRVCIRGALEVHIHQLSQVGPDDLIRVDKHHLRGKARQTSADGEGCRDPPEALVETFHCGALRQVATPPAARSPSSSPEGTGRQGTESCTPK